MRSSWVQALLLKLGMWVFWLGVAALVAHPILQLDGWPRNHDFLSIFERVEIFRRGFLEGDFFPVWSVHAMGSKGTPMPFFYHRLYNTVAGLWAVLCGDTLQAVRGLVVPTLAIGAVGMVEWLKKVGMSRHAQILGGVLFVSSQYWAFDWLIRGAMAEAWALMIIPWLLAALWELSSPTSSRFQSVWVCLKVGLIASLLFYAHSVIFLFATPLLILGCLWVWEAQNFKAFLAKASLCALGVIGGIGPMVYAISVFKPHYRIEEATTTGGYEISNGFKPFEKYLFHRGFQWTETWDSVHVEVGRYTFLPFLLVVGFGWGWIVYKKYAEKKNIFSFDAKEKALWIFPLVLYFLMQMSFVEFFYRAVPGAKYIQFPWRLMSFVTPFLIALEIRLLDRIFALLGRPRVGRALLWAGAVLQVATFATLPPDGDPFTAKAIREYLSGEGLDNGGTYGGEYVPSLKKTAEKDFPEKENAPVKCPLTLESVGGGVEGNQRKWVGRLGPHLPEEGCRLVLGVYRSPFIQVWLLEGSGKGREAPISAGGHRVMTPENNAQMWSTFLPPPMNTYENRWFQVESVSLWRALQAPHLSFD